MTISWDMARVVFQFLQVVVYPVLAVVIYQWRQQKGRVGRLEKELAALRTELVRVRACLDNAPTSEAMHDLELGLSSMNGEVRGVAKDISSIAEAVKRVERVLDMHSEHLLKGTIK